MQPGKSTIHLLSVLIYLLSVLLYLISVLIYLFKCIVILIKCNWIHLISISIHLISQQVDLNKCINTLIKYNNTLNKCIVDLQTASVIKTETRDRSDIDDRRLTAVHVRLHRMTDRVV